MTEQKKSNAEGNLIYLDDSRTSKNIVISGLLVALSEDDIALSGNTLGNSDGELSITHGLERSPDWTGDGDEGGIHVTSTRVEAAASHQVHLRACHDGVHRAHHERGEGLHGKRSVAGGTRDNEGGGDGVHLIEVEGVVEGLGEGDFTERGAQVCAVSGLGGEDAASGCQVGVAHDGGCGSEVGADSDAWGGY